MTRILVVEDEHLVGRHIQNMLQGLGYEVTKVVSTGREAIAQAEESPPDLILMDIMLKGDMDGIAAAEKIWGSHGIPIVYLTAFADEATLQRAKVTQPFGYLLKPFEDRELYTAVEMALYKYALDVKLKERERWLSTILTSIADGVISTDREGRVSFMNSVAETLTGRTRENSLGRNLKDVFQLIGEKTQKKLNISLDLLLEEKPWLPPGEGVFLIQGKGKIPVEVGAALIRDEKGHVDGTVLILRDITERKLHEQELRHQAIHDSLTGLPNRTLFNELLALSIAGAARHKDHIAVLMLDLDRFKRVNDTFGHSTGDELLKKVAERLKSILRKSDTVARLGGDEFLLLLPEMAGADLAATVAKRILDSIRAPFLLDSRTVEITVSVGIALYPEDAEEGETLVKNSDDAMYAAKKAGRDTSRRFHRKTKAGRSKEKP